MGPKAVIYITCNQPQDIVSAVVFTVMLMICMIQAKQKGVRLELLDKKALLANLANLYIEADIHKMGEVMRNLLSNAIKFTPRSGYVHVKVIVTDANPAIADSDKSAALSLSAVSLQSALLRAGRVQSRVDAGAEGQSKRANGTDKKMVLRIEVTDSGAGISPVSPLGLSLELAHGYLVSSAPIVRRGPLMISSPPPTRRRTRNGSLMRSSNSLRANCRAGAGPG